MQTASTSVTLVTLPFGCYSISLESLPGLARRKAVSTLNGRELSGGFKSRKIHIEALLESSSTCLSAEVWTLVDCLVSDATRGTE